MELQLPKLLRIVGLFRYFKSFKKEQFLTLTLTDQYLGKDHLKKKFIKVMGYK